jgi:hypothetical protein
MPDRRQEPEVIKCSQRCRFGPPGAYTEMRQAGAITVALEMVANNDVARRFYERKGFTTTFVQMHRRLGPE